MELAPGEDLAERIARGPIAVDEAIPLFLQIAAGLEAAHEKGIVHRDLKPANVMVGPDGAVKILDFGLAKAMEPEPLPGGGDLSQSPTMTAAATMRGEIMGTAAYMAPEQAKGRWVDKRADIWAFGCVLFEALTGRRAFVGEDAPDTLAAVLRAEIDLSALPPEVPAELRRLLERCLRRDVAHRLRDIGDARIELEEIEGGAAAETVQAPSSRARRSSLVVGGRDGSGRRRRGTRRLVVAPCTRRSRAGSLLVPGARDPPGRGTRWRHRSRRGLEPGWKDDRLLVGRRRHATHLPAVAGSARGAAGAGDGRRHVASLLAKREVAPVLGRRDRRRGAQGPG